MTSTIKHTYKIITACKNWQRGSGWYNSDVLDEDEITLDGPMPEDYLDSYEWFDWILDNLPETARQHDGDDEETLWTVSAYELVEDEWGDLCKADDEPAVEAKRWECDLWEHFYPDGKEC